MDIKFPTQYEKRHFESSVGSRYVPIYTAAYNDFGVLELEQTGEKDIYLEIQSYKESVDINTILNRYMSGDIDVLSKVNGFFEDVSEFPRNYCEVLNAGIKAEQFFNELPVDVKKKFNNSFSEFLVASGSDDFLLNFVDTESSDSTIVSDDNSDGGVDNES